MMPLLYIPRWYWQQIGSPSLAGLPPLWSSRYPDNVVGTLADEWADVPAHFWNGYGGLDVLLLQFTSSARIAGYQPLDASAFRGTRAQLAARMGGQTEEDEMFTPDDFERFMWGNVFDGPPQGGRNFAAYIKDMDAKLTALAAKAAGASAEEIAAKLLPALTTALVAEVAKVDAISDADAAQIAEAVTARAGALLGGGQ